MSNRFMTMKLQAEVLERLDSVLEGIIKDHSTEWKCVGKTDEQDTNWRTGELLWEDDEQTIPKYRDKYDYVEKDDDEYSEEDLMYLDICNDFRTRLEKLIR